jgi:triphosphoribosyl-dephospho-CoA synthetase
MIGRRERVNGCMAEGDPCLQEANEHVYGRVHSLGSQLRRAKVDGNKWNGAQTMYDGSRDDKLNQSAWKETRHE